MGNRPRRTTQPWPATVAEAVSVQGFAAGSSAMTITSPNGWSGYRLSGHVLHPQHSRSRRAAQNTRAGIDRLDGRVTELRSILSEYLNADGHIADGRSFRAAFRLEATALDDGRTRMDTVVYDRDRARKAVLSTIHHHDPDDTYGQDDFHRTVAEFLEWSQHDSKRRRSARAA